jgi:hypothetical protein
LRLTVLFCLLAFVLGAAATTPPVRPCPFPRVFYLLILSKIYSASAVPQFVVVVVVVAAAAAAAAGKHNKKFRII